MFILPNLQTIQRVSCQANVHFWKVVLQDPSRAIKIFISIYPVIPLLETFYKKNQIL